MIQQPGVRLVEEARFEFGRNWRGFLSVLNDERIAEAKRSLETMLGPRTLQDRSFLDIGSGSGLFSLAAVLLGAARVHSFDFDPESVAATREIKARYAADVEQWTMETGSILDGEYLANLGPWDFVYSWGVLHHTGDMWGALANVTHLVAPGGVLFIALYNYQPGLTQWNTLMKRTYVRSPRLGKYAMLGCFAVTEVVRGSLVDLVMLRNPLKRYLRGKRSRGMSLFHDWIDWVGGYPFEAATPDEVFDFFHQRGFTLERMTTCGGGSGCNQYVFRRP